MSRLLGCGALLMFVVFTYAWPALRARAELGEVVPAAFAPDLTMYVALSTPPASGTREFQNPYYRESVPYGSTGYLKFHLAPGLFSKLRGAFPDRLWSCVFVWNLFWWALLGGLAVYFFRRYLPNHDWLAVVFGTTLLTLTNISSLKPLFFAWLHLPSLAGFEPLELPFMRAFIPVMPIVFLLAYLALQIEALRRVHEFVPWIAMAILQFLALATFPYTTLMMAGLTAVAVLANWSRFENVGMIAIVGAYGIICGLIDAMYAMKGPLGFYDDHSSLIHLQFGLMPHLIGGNWLLLALFTLGLSLQRNLSPEVKWPIAGLGVSNLLFMLGDAVVPARAILLSHHAGYFVHTSTALIVTFTIIALSVGVPKAKVRFVGACAVGILMLNGLFMSIGVYRGWNSYNKESSEFATLLAKSLKPQADELIIARSIDVDDTCGLVSLVSHSQVLYCTDAEVMLTPKQNLDIHRFRQAIYLYLTGFDSASLGEKLAQPNRVGVIARLGYWGEAASHSLSEQDEGAQAIQTQIMPLLDRIEHKDPRVRDFLGQFHRIVMVDSLSDPIFVKTRLEALLDSQGEFNYGSFRIGTYTPKSDKPAGR